MEENKKRFDREALMDILPHRGRMLLLDSAWLEAEDSAQGSYRVRGDEWFLDGHFPATRWYPAWCCARSWPRPAACCWARR